MVLYNDVPVTKTYALTGSEPRSVGQELPAASQEHPEVKSAEDPWVQAERERRLESAAVKAKIEWQQTATNKLWNLIRSPMEVYKHCGQKLDKDPRLS